MFNLDMSLLFSILVLKKKKKSKFSGVKLTQNLSSIGSCDRAAKLARTIKLYGLLRDLSTSCQKFIISSDLRK